MLRMRRELILNFHGIGKPPCNISAQESNLWISREDFAALADCIAVLGLTAHMPIGITFDDGNLSDINTALPELCNRRLTASFFVCAGRLKTSGYLNPSAVRDLLKAGMKIGSHGMHHRNWRKMHDAALTEEVDVTRKVLEDVCGEPITSAAIPFGSYDRRVLAKLRASKFQQIFTSDSGLAEREAWLKSRNSLSAKCKPQDIHRLLARKYTGLWAMMRVYKRLR